MVTTNWFIIKLATQTLIRDGWDCAFWVCELNVSDQRCICWQVNARQSKNLGRSIVSESLDLSLWLNKVVSTLKTRANCWIISNHDFDLWCCLVCTQHFKWNSLIVNDIIGRIDKFSIVGDQSGTSERVVDTSDDLHLFLWTIWSKESNVVGQTIFSVVKSTGSPDIEFVVGIRAIPWNHFVYPVTIVSKWNVLSGVGICGIAVTNRSWASESKGTIKWCITELYISRLVNRDRSLWAFDHLDTGNRSLRNKFFEDDMVH